MKQAHNTPTQMQSAKPAEKNILYLWCLRILMPCGGYRKFVEKQGFSSDEVLSILGLEKYTEKDVKRTTAIKKLKQMHADAEQRSFSYSPVLQRKSGTVYSFTQYAM